MRTKGKCALLAVLIAVATPAAARPPDWLRELAAQPIPAQPSWREAVQLLNDVSLTVSADGKQHRHVRGAFRLLRQSGDRRALLKVSHNEWMRVLDMQGWTIPPDGKPYQVRFKDAVDAALPEVDDSSLVSDVRTEVLLIPGAHPGATVGYEYDVEENGLEQADDFYFQDVIPVLRATYSLQLPPGWTVTPRWVNHAAAEPVQERPGHWQWTLRDLPAVPIEAHMPSWQAVVGQLFLAYSRPGSMPELASWSGIGAWLARLVEARRTDSPELRTKVTDLLQETSTPLERVRALAMFVQRDVRYVAIELGIGGYQPHAAADTFAHRFGDCKDKATLLSVMLAQAGIDSTLIMVNTDREQVGSNTPPGLWFNHVILAIHLPPDTPGDGLLSAIDAPGGGRLLFFDPTDEVTPVGRLPGELQGAYGLPVIDTGARLVQLPRVTPAENGIRRTGTLKLDASGRLSGDMDEFFLGDAARVQRYALRMVKRDTEVVRPLQFRLASSLAQFTIDKASIRDRNELEKPFEWHYTFEAGAYASHAGDLLLVRPRVVGVVAEDLSEEKPPRVHDLSFAGVGSEQDEFTIELPAGYVVDELPQPLDVDIGFAAYHSRVKVEGTRLKYTRSFELRDLAAPAAQFEKYRQFQLDIARDERAVAIFKPAGT